jgi:hypothetical protein
LLSRRRILLIPGFPVRHLCPDLRKCFFQHWNATWSKAVLGDDKVAHSVKPKRPTIIAQMTSA